MLTTVHLTRTAPAVGLVETGASATPAATPDVSSVQARHLGDFVVPPRGSRLSGETLAVIAALAGVAAIALGAVAMAMTFASDESGPGSSVPETRVALEGVSPAPGSVAPATPALALLAKPSTQRIPFTGSKGRLILAVGTGGRGVLVLNGLRPAPKGKSYRAWLIAPGGKILGSAALFSGRQQVVPLSRRVSRGASVGVTVERAGGVAAPTRKPTLVARRGAA